MAIVANEARNFETIAKEFAFEKRQRSRYVSINAVLNEQSDLRLLNDVVQLQTTIREDLAHSQIEVLESPGHGKGLYIYPKESLHCTLFFDPRLRVSASQEELDALVEKHPWRLIETGKLDSLMACPRWFYSHLNNDPTPTTTFSLQLHFNAEQFIKIRDLFLNALPNGIANPSKVRMSGMDIWVRATINIARLMSDEFERLPPDLSCTLCDLYVKLNRLADDCPATQLDVLSLYKSNAWLSAPSSVIQVYRLR
jgi:hypothetical protein